MSDKAKEGVTKQRALAACLYNDCFEKERDLKRWEVCVPAQYYLTLGKGREGSQDG